VQKGYSNMILNGIHSMFQSPEITDMVAPSKQRGSWKTDCPIKLNNYMSKGIRKNGTKLGFQKGNKI